MKSILCVKNLYKSFQEDGYKNVILKDVNFTVEEGEFVAVMGPSGSGKSTLLYTVSGMDQADSGEILFEETDIVKSTDQELTQIRRDKMGYVFQQPSLLKNLNILDNIILLAMRTNHKEAKKILERAKLLMEETGILDLAKRDISKVSGGQLQRAGICRALMSQPKILFADEPTGALNSKASDEIMDIFLQVNKERNTIMLVTHDARVAAKADKVLFMRDGRVEKNVVLGKYTEESILLDRIQMITGEMQRLEI